MTRRAVTNGEAVAWLADKVGQEITTIVREPGAGRTEVIGPRVLEQIRPNVYSLGGDPLPYFRHEPRAVPVRVSETVLAWHARDEHDDTVRMIRYHIKEDEDV